MDRLKDKVAIVIGAGQSPGEEMGNGRATTIRFLQEGARVLAVDRNPSSATDSIAQAGEGVVDALAFAADTSVTETLQAAVNAAMARWGRIDILHYNVGVSIAAGPQMLEDMTDETFDRVNAINLRGAIMATKFVTPIMQAQGGGVVTLVASMTAIETYTPIIAYRTSKAGMIAFMQQYAAHHAKEGIRANCILPGLMQTSMSIDTRMRTTGKPRDEIIAERNARVPLRNRGGSGWDVANAALFLASDEAGFITGASLPVDGGTLTRIGW